MRSIVLPVLLTTFFAASALGQTPPAGPAKSLDYRDKPAEEVLTDLARSFGIIIVKNERLDFPLTLTSPQPVTAADAANLLNEALWDHHHLLYGNETLDHKQIIRVAALTTRPPEVRTWPHSNILHNASDLPAFLPGVTESQTINLRVQWANLTEILNLLAASGIVPPKVDPRDEHRIAINAPKPLNIRQAIEVTSEALFTYSKRLEIDMQTDPTTGRLGTHLKVVPIEIKKKHHEG